MTDVKVVFIINGKEHETSMSESESILEAALKLQINPPYSCLEGICGSCSAVLEQGLIKDEGDANEGSARIIKTCMAQPKSKFLRLNYDKTNT